MDEQAQVAQYVAELNRLRSRIEDAPNIATAGLFEWDAIQATPENPYPQEVDEIVPLEDALSFIELDATVSSIRYSDRSRWLGPRPVLDDAGEPIREPVHNAAGEPIQIGGEPVWSEKSTPPRDRGVLLLAPPPSAPLDSVLQRAASLGGPTYCSGTAETEALIEVMHRGGKLLSKPGVAPLIWPSTQEDGPLVAEANPSVAWASLLVTLSERDDLFENYASNWWHWSRDPVGPFGLGSVSTIAVEMPSEWRLEEGRRFDTRRQGAVIRSVALASREAIDWLIQTLNREAVELQKRDAGRPPGHLMTRAPARNRVGDSQQEAREFLEYCKQFELSASEKAQLQEEWPWLDWENGTLKFVLSSDRKLCLPIRDGAEVPAACLPDVIRNGDTRCIPTEAPSLASYREIADRPQREMMADIRCGFDSIYDSITDIENPEPIPKQILLQQPELAAWLNGELPSYAPTRVEYGILWPAFIERRRKLRDRSLLVGSSVERRQSPSDDTQKLSAPSPAVSDNPGSEGWSREMSKTEAGKLLGCSGDDRTCRDHLASLLDGRSDVIQSRTSQKHRFCLAWVRSIEPTTVNNFQPR